MINHAFTTHERIYLITRIFSDRDQVDMVRNLSGDDAQNFIDMMDEVSLHTISHLEDRPTDFDLI